MFNNIKIGLRMTIDFCIVIVFMIAIIAVSLNQMAESHKMLNRIVKVNNVRVKSANNMIENAREVALSVRGIMMLEFAEESDDKIRNMKDYWVESWRLYHQNVVEVKKLISENDTTGFVLLGKIEVAADSSQLLTSKAIDLALDALSDL